MDNAKISKLTQEVIKQATRIHKEHSTSDEDTIFIANAFLNATKILYTQALGEEVATSLLLEVMRQSFGDQSRTLH
jgi:predicted nucleic acid-binding protein|tara:strand:+ start:65 stop:292 length:228 start_codon:yes stop_codon:yes gene_type:complete